MIKGGDEDNGSCGDGSDHEASSPSSALALTVSRVSSSTNGNHGSSAASTSVVSSPLRRTLEEAISRSQAQIVGSALVALGQEVMVSGTVGAAAPLTSISSILGHLGERSSLIGVGGVTDAPRLRASSNKSSGSDGSNSTSPLSLNMVGSVGGGKTGPKPRAADSPGSGSTTSTTTGQAGRDKVFRCAICQRCFGYKHVLQNHERTHTGEKPFECRECHKRFTRDHHLKTHMRLHTGEKPYSCTHCDRQFVQVANLRRHLRVHTGERPYACEICESRFSDSNQLKAHNLIHKGEKPFECQKCLGRFRRRHHLMHHKCPKDEANIGRPKRGRRPRAYDHNISSSGGHFGMDHPTTPSPPGSGSASPPSPVRLSPSSHHITSDHHHHHSSHNRHNNPSSAISTVSSSTSQLLAASSTAGLYPFPSGLLPHLPLLTSPRDHHRDYRSSQVSPPVAHGTLDNQQGVVSSESSSKSRRKPKTTMRIVSAQQREILTPEQKELFYREPMQTQPLNMSVSPTVTIPKKRGLHHLYGSSFGNRNNNAGGDVLDLSRSRSDVDSEAEHIEEDVEDDMDDDEMDDEDMMHHESMDSSNPQDLSSTSGVAGNGDGPVSLIKNSTSSNNNSNNNHNNGKNGKVCMFTTSSKRENGF